MEMRGETRSTFFEKKVEPKSLLEERKEDRRIRF